MYNIQRIYVIFTPKSSIIFFFSKKIMNSLQIQIGRRLKEIREKILNEGIKLSASQFAQLLNSNEDKIRNYELGRSGIPVEFLYTLYHRGINLNYLITGESSKFADNESGRTLRKKTEGDKANKKDKEQIYKLGTANLSADELINIIDAAAGDIRKILSEKK